VPPHHQPHSAQEGRLMTGDPRQSFLLRLLSLTLSATLGGVRRVQSVVFFVVNVFVAVASAAAAILPRCAACP
jgi:hypothetical protein